MAPKRKNAELPLKSIWDETLLSPVLTNPLHRAKLWNHLILATRNSLPPSRGDDDADRMKKNNPVVGALSSSSCNDNNTNSTCKGPSDITTSHDGQMQIEATQEQQLPQPSCNTEVNDGRCGSPTPSSAPSVATTGAATTRNTTGYKFKSVISLKDLPYHAWNIPKKQAQRIVEEFSLFTTKIVERSESSRGDTTKLLVELQDGHQVETVIMRHVGHATACLSSQIGCQMGCRFCATGTMGIIGDLTSGEIIEQLIHANSITRIRNVVFMGMGEPLNNYDNLKKAVEFMVDTRRLAMSPKHVTVSTVGVLKSMYRLSDEMPFVNLALSLHAPNQDVRVQIVPAARAHPIEKLLDAVDYHIEQNRKLFEQGFQGIDCPATTHVSSTVTTMDKRINTSSQSQNQSKRVSKVTGCMIEYILIRDVNDKDEHAHELAKLLQPRRDHVLLNLIPYNPTEVAEDYAPPTDEQVASFHQICISEPYKIHCRVRQEKGQDIAGACGQLALVNASKKSNPAATTSDSDKSNPSGTTTDLEDMHSLRTESSSVGGGKYKSYQKASISDSDAAVRYKSDVQTKRRFCSMLVKANVLLTIAVAASSIIAQKLN